MLVVLPPSETKAAGGRGRPLDLDALSFPSLNPTRKALVDEVVALAADLPASRAALDVSERQDDEIARNAALWSSPTTPALRRYTGVLYDALDAASLTTAARRRLVVCSALFGLVGATDPIPAYRLSAGSGLPGREGLRTLWRPEL
ncbi:MAG TPA: peroxide stress protein YaaA, partial [Actinomycetospora sp.]|nr:peroxide stress protein YaaA [Actinomycetospora sp.]